MPLYSTVALTRSTHYRCGGRHAFSLLISHSMLDRYFLLHFPRLPKLRGAASAHYPLLLPDPVPLGVRLLQIKTSWVTAACQSVDQTLPYSE